MAPPTIIPTANGYTGLVERPIDTSSPTTTSRATTPITGPRPVPWENAIPLLKARLKRNDPMMSMLRSVSVLNAQRLVS